MRSVAIVAFLAACLSLAGATTASGSRSPAAIGRAAGEQALFAQAANNTPRAAHRPETIGPLLQSRQIRSRSACLQMLPRLRQACAARPFTHGHAMEVLVADLDGDGKSDAVIRYLSLVDCGSHGCATDIYRGVGSARFVKVDLNLVTMGPSVRCRLGREVGVGFPANGRNFACFSIV